MTRENFRRNLAVYCDRIQYRRPGGFVWRILRALRRWYNDTRNVTLDGIEIGWIHRDWIYGGWTAHLKQLPDRTLWNCGRCPNRWAAELAVIYGYLEMRAIPERWQPRTRPGMTMHCLDFFGHVYEDGGKRG